MKDLLDSEQSIAVRLPTSSTVSTCLHILFAMNRRNRKSCTYELWYLHVSYTGSRTNKEPACNRATGPQHHNRLSSRNPPSLSLSFFLSFSLSNKPLTMCYHKLYLFSHCGNSYQGKKVGTPCTNTYISLPNATTTPTPLSPFAQWPLSPNSPTPCTKQSRPYHTLKIYSLCLRCAKSRLSRLAMWDESLPAAGAAVKAQRGSGASPLNQRLSP
jgi:hypothetical protein